MGKKTKKILAILLVLCLVFTFAACKQTIDDAVSSEAKATKEAKTTKEAKATKAPTKEKLFDKETTISLLAAGHPSWPYDEDWLVYKLLEEATNVKFEIISIVENFNEKFTTIMASGDLPDVMFLNGAKVNQYYAQGPFVAYSDHMDELENVKAFLATSKDFQDLQKIVIMPDGKSYLFNISGVQIINRRGWMARLDILEKESIDVPENQDELYDVLTQLKEIYPDSYPLTFRGGVRQFQMIAPQYGTFDDAYYDFDNDVWKFGPIEDQFKVMIEFYKKLYLEELIPTDYLNMSTKGWTDIMSTDRAIFTVDYINRMDYFNGPLREVNPDANLQTIMPIAGKGGDNIFPKTDFVDLGAVVTIGKNTDNALKYIDWMHSEECMLIVSWGQEDVSYQLDDKGKKEFINIPPGERTETVYGLCSVGSYIRRDPLASLKGFSQEVADSLNYNDLFCQSDFNPKWWIKLNPDQKSIDATVGEAIRSHYQEQVSLFLIDERDLAEWDDYVQEIKDLGVDQYLAICEEAYNSVK